MEIDLFPASDFDGWAGSYDQDVLDEEHFPFIGYRQALQTVVRLADPQPGQRVLDLGAGTGNLASAFAARGCQVWATDFSVAMLEVARQKLPQVQFLQADVRHGWPAPLTGAFHCIVSAYVFHHFELPEKARLCALFAERLALQGKLVIADIAFPDQAALQAMRQQSGEYWEDELYWLADETLPALRRGGLQASYIAVSPCAGVFLIEKA